MNVAEVVDAVEIRLDVAVSQALLQFRWDDLTTSGCSLILQFSKGYADEPRGWAEPS